jgi:hypothetical protein
LVMCIRRENLVVKFRKVSNQFFVVIPAVWTSWFVHQSPRQSGIVM